MKKNKCLCKERETDPSRAFEVTSIGLDEVVRRHIFDHFRRLHLLLLIAAAAAAAELLQDVCRAC